MRREKTDLTHNKINENKDMKQFCFSGKVLAFIGLKLIMVNILQNFEIEADGKFPEMLLKCDITVRSLNGYKVRLKPRVWSN